EGEGESLQRQERAAQEGPQGWATQEGRRGRGGGRVRRGQQHRSLPAGAAGGADRRLPFLRQGFGPPRPRPRDLSAAAGPQHRRLARGEMSLATATFRKARKERDAHSFAPFASFARDRRRGPTRSEATLQADRRWTCPSADVRPVGSCVALVGG